MTATDRGRAASDRLTVALVTAASKGLRPHCSHPGGEWLWLSEHEADRSEAAKLCGGCPVITECGQAAEANQERGGVWAGVDRSVRPGRKKAARPT
jgi:hypothetical protein